MTRFLVIALFALGCDSGEPARCSSAADCEGTEMCLDGSCVPRLDSGTPDAPTDGGCSCGPGEVCGAAGCAADCGNPLSTACGAGTECDFATGACVAEGTAGALTGAGTRCGGATGPLCLPGTECNVSGACQAAPPCVVLRCTDDGSTCWGGRCASTRPVAACTPAPLERINMPDFLRAGLTSGGVVDLELDDACNVYGATTVSGPDYLLELAPDGTLSRTTGVTNLNMGEVAVLRPYSDEFSTSPGEVALTYTCCASCGCVGGDPQGVARLDRTGPALPLVITATGSTGTGPFGSIYLDTGPFGLTWGRDRTLYVGNVVMNGDLHRADLTTGTSGEIARLPGRIYATTSFDGASLLVAIEGGEVLRVSTDGVTQLPFATLEDDVTSMVRDPFLGVVYVSTSSGSVEILAADGTPSGTLIAAGGAPGRIAYGPEGALYYLRLPAEGPLFAPMVERMALPTTRP